jgi:hypothetical protein
MPFIGGNIEITIHQATRTGYRGIVLAQALPKALFFTIFYADKFKFRS